MVRAITCCAITAFIWAYVESADYTKIVQTTYGPVRGLIIDDGIKFLSFTGIPYAASPVGELRFQAPKSPANWTNTKDVTRFGRVCHQPGQFDKLKLDFRSRLKLLLTNVPGIAKFTLRYLRQSEDCLNLNVYTTQLGEKGLKPVMVWIHGGGFILGDGTDTMYGPEYLMDQDIVVVTINYRIGPLGFLATNTTDAPGNWGLKDQVAALRWVQDNIANFGGDPKQVTIYGESAGGVSVHFHVLSPLSRGLFQKAIVSSGSALNHWATTNEPERFSRNLARVLGASESEIEDSGRRIQFLRKINAKTLTDKMSDALEDKDILNGMLTKIPFPPVVEPSGTEEAFLLEQPSKIIMDGNFARVPIMIGFNDVEGGLMNIGFSTINSPEGVKKLEDEPCQILPENLRVRVEAKNDCAKVFQQVKDLYFDGKGMETNEEAFTHMFGDVAITYGVHLAQKWHARLAKKENPAYFYYFTYDGEWNLIKKMFNGTVRGIGHTGALHGDDVTYIFKPQIMHLPFREPTASGVKTKERMVHFISSFVKFANPTPTISDLTPFKWEPAKENEVNTMHIDSDITLEKGVLKERMDFWESLHKKYIGTSLYD